MSYWVPAGVLVFLYSIISIFCFVQIIKILNYKHDIYSFQFGFVLLSLIWCVGRVFLLIALASLTSTDLSSLLFQIPLCIQFATYSLIVLFYLKIIYRDSWDQSGGLYKKIYVCVNCFLLSSLIILYSIPISWDTKDALFVWGIAIVWVCLVIVLGWVAIRLSRITEARQNHVLFQASGISSRSILLLSGSFFAIFVSRSTVDILVLFWFDSPNLLSSDHLEAWGSFLCFLIWEIAPTVIVLFLFRTIPKPRYVRRLTDSAGDVNDSLRNSHDTSSYNESFINDSLIGAPRQNYDSFPDFSYFAVATPPAINS